MYYFGSSPLSISNNAIIRSPKPTNIASFLSWDIEYVPSRARLINIAKKTTIISTINIGIYLINGININREVTTTRRRNTDHHHKDCLRWNCSKSLFLWLLNAPTMIPIRRYIITALFFSVLLGVYDPSKDWFIMGIVISGFFSVVLTCNVSSICIKEKINCRKQFYARINY